MADTPRVSVLWSCAVVVLAACIGSLSSCAETDGADKARSVAGRGVDAAADEPTASSGGEQGRGGSGGDEARPTDGGRDLDAGSGGRSAGSGGGGGASSAGGASPNPAPSASPVTPNPNIIPGAWRCTVLAYRDGTCDCGCGTADPDCPSDDIDDCVRCDATESCAVGSCPASVDPDDTTTCVAVPARWTCTESDYFDDDCDCGCGVADPRCDDAELSSCDSCNSMGACSALACPGAIDAEDNARCAEAPRDWTCDETEYFDEDCDCGCGVADPSCVDAELSSCDSCNPAGGCSLGACPGAIDSADTTSCFVPEGWSCDLSDYGDDRCNCGCGVLDIDCASAAVDVCEVCWGGCSIDACPGPIDAVDNTICTGPPNAWSCEERFYRDGSLCHCGCGAIDPDCETDTIESCDRCDFEGSCSSLTCPGTIDPDAIAHCMQLEPPTDWTCPAYRYADGYCDCGCGVADIDCADATIESCEDCAACGSACPARVDPVDPTQCAEVPGEWRCDGYMYGDGYSCDCGCGTVDPDCETVTSDSCDYCPLYSGSCAGKYCEDVLPEDNAHCVGDAPAEWTCEPTTYNDQACDCGCGAVDRDCATAESECDLCNAPGSCADGDCELIDPTNNAACTP